MRSALLRKTGLLIFFVPLVSCVTPMHKAVENVRPGMEKDEVLELLGSPAQSRRVKGHDEWTYIYYIEGDRQGKDIRFLAGKVTSVQSAELGPGPKEKLMDAKSMKEYESHVKQLQQENESGFTEMDQ